MARDCFKYRGTLPCQFPQATECTWHHCRRRHCSHSSKRCSGVGAASALSKVIASGLHSRSAASPSFTSHHPAAGLAHSFPVLYTTTTDLPWCFLLPVGNRRPSPWRDKGNATEGKRSLICFGGAAGTAATQQLPRLSCTPHSSHLPDEQLPQQCTCDYPYMHIYMPNLFPVPWNYMPQF